MPLFTFQEEAGGVSCAEVPWFSWQPLQILHRALVSFSCSISCQGMICTSFRTTNLRITGYVNIQNFKHACFTKFNLAFTLLGLLCIKETTKLLWQAVYIIILAVSSYNWFHEWASYKNTGSWQCRWTRTRTRAYVHYKLKWIRVRPRSV